MRVSGSNSKTWAKFVVCTDAGVLGFYSSNSSRHIKKTVLAFRYKAQAAKLAEYVTKSAGVDSWIEERDHNDLLDEDKRIERVRRKYGKGKKNS